MPLWVGPLSLPLQELGLDLGVSDSLPASRHPEPVGSRRDGPPGRRPEGVRAGVERQASSLASRGLSWRSCLRPLPAPAPPGLELELEPRPAVLTLGAGAACARRPEPSRSTLRQPDERARPGPRPQERRECDPRAPRPEPPRSAPRAPGRVGCDPARPHRAHPGRRRGPVAGGGLTVAWTPFFFELPLVVSLLCKKVMAV